MTRANAVPRKRKPKARANGEGSIFQRKSDGRWLYQRTVNGRLVTISATTQAALVKRKDELDKPIRQGRGKALRDRSMTMAQLLDLWLAAMEDKIRTNTLNNYRILCEQYLKPALGQVRLTDLSKLDVDLMLRERRGTLADSTRRRLRTLLVQALDYAERSDLVDRNVARRSEPVVVKRTESAWFTPEEAFQLREVIRGERLEALYLLYMTAGLRRGEALALQWGDVDLEHGRATISQSLTVVAHQPNVPGEVKTETGKRTVPLAGLVVDALRELKPAAAMPKDYVFLSTVGTLLDPDNVSRDFRHITERAGLGKRHLHELRHFVATLALDLGVPESDVSRMLGHASTRITHDLYRHETPAALERAAAAIEGAFR